MNTLYHTDLYITYLIFYVYTSVPVFVCVEHTRGWKTRDPSTLNSNVPSTAPGSAS